MTSARRGQDEGQARANYLTRGGRGQTTTTRVPSVSLSGAHERPLAWPSQEVGAPRETRTRNRPRIEQGASATVTIVDKSHQPKLSASTRNANTHTRETRNWNWATRNSCVCNRQTGRELRSCTAGEPRLPGACSCALCTVEASYVL